MEKKRTWESMILQFIKDHPACTVQNICDGMNDQDIDRMRGAIKRLSAKKAVKGSGRNRGTTYVAIGDMPEDGRVHNRFKSQRQRETEPQRKSPDPRPMTELEKCFGWFGPKSMQHDESEVS